MFLENMKKQAYLPVSPPLLTLPEGHSLAPATLSLPHTLNSTNLRQRFSAASLLHKLGKSNAYPRCLAAVEENITVESLLQV